MMYIGELICKKWGDLRMQILKIGHPALHCTKNPIYVFPEMKLHGLIPNTFIYVSDSDL